MRNAKKALSQLCLAESLAWPGLASYTILRNYRVSAVIESEND